MRQQDRKRWLCLRGKVSCGDLPCGNARNNCHGRYVLGYYGAGCDHASLADRHAVENRGTGTDPYIIFYGDSLSCLTLFGYWCLRVVEYMVCRYANHVSCNLATFADYEAAMAVNNRVGIYRTTLSYFDGTAIGRNYHALMYVAASAYGDMFRRFLAHLDRG